MPGAIERVCPVCASCRSAAQLQKGDMQLVRCLDCGMTYANPAPGGMASGVYYEEQGESFYLSPAKLEADYSPMRYERELRLFREFCQDGMVLDVGCSSGAFLHHLKAGWPLSYEVLGTDVSGPPLNHAESRGVPVLRGDFLTADVSKQFDAVTFWAVLEHLLEPSKFLVRAHGLLKANGWCFALVPNMASLAVRCLGAKYRYIYPQHLNYFTADTLRELGLRTGFEIVALRSTHFNPIVIWQDFCRPRTDVPNSERAQLLRKTTRLKRLPVLSPVRWMYRLTERALGSGLLADNLALVLRKR